MVMFTFAAMTKLSVNINKIATLRNSRGGNNPDLVKVALDCERFGAQGITVHPRPDERHIRYEDTFDLKAVIATEFNIEEKAVAPYLAAAHKANELGIGINAGHDLDLHNLHYFAQTIPGLLEVSIGHALISDALYLGLEDTIKRYLTQLTPISSK